MTETSRFNAATAIMIAVLLVAFGALVASRGPQSKTAATQAPHLVSMEESGQAMQQAGDAMKAHGEAMLDEGKRPGEQDLAAHGEHWLNDAQALVQGAEWMAMDPKAFSSLTSRPGDPAIQENWGALVRGSEAMLHDPSRAGATDLEALRWNGQGMVAEGRNMAEHGRVMAEEVEVMVVRHKLRGQAGADLRQAAQAMIDVGGHLSRNGQEMVDYADRLRRNLGIP